MKKLSAVLVVAFLALSGAAGASAASAEFHVQSPCCKIII